MAPKDVWLAAAALVKKMAGGRRSSDLIDLSELLSHPRVRNESAIRSMCQVAYLGETSALCRTLGRYKMFVDTRDVGLSSHLMLEGYWEMWVTEALVSSIRAGMIVADIGANVGYFTLLMADLVGPTGLVHAFEPNPQLTRRLSDSLSINGFAERVALHEVALSDTEGDEVILVVPRNEPKNGNIVPYAGEVPENGHLVTTARLDAKPDWSRIELAKIDVEGAEEFVWAGMRGLLETGTLRTVILEFTSGRYDSPAAFLDTICEAGFSLARIDLKRGIVPASRTWVLDQSPHEDIMLYLTR